MKFGTHKDDEYAYKLCTQCCFEVRNYKILW